MAVEIKRKTGENTYSLLRRFRDKVKKGRVLSLSKNNFYYQKPASKRKQKENALRRKKNREKREFDIKTGKIEEDVNGFRDNSKKRN